MLGWHTQDEVTRRDLETEEKRQRDTMLRMWGACAAAALSN